MSTTNPENPGSLDPLDSSESLDPPVFPKGSLHPDPADAATAPQASPGEAAGPEEYARGAHGRYGLEEEPEENSDPVPRTPKTADQLARDRERDEAVRETGEDLG